MEQRVRILITINKKIKNYALAYTLKTGKNIKLN